MTVTPHGIYILKDSYYEKYDINNKMMDNKRETRPHYFAIELDDILWMIPMSSKVEKYREKINEAESKGKKCLYYHIGKFAGKESAFLIGDMIPVTEQYILREYTVAKVPYVVKDSDLNRKLTSKAKRFLLLARQKKIRPYIDVFDIEKDLKQADK